MPPRVTRSRARRSRWTSRLQVSGVPQLSSPVRLKLQGPYVSGGATRIPSFDWRLNATALGFPVGGRLVSTGVERLPVHLWRRLRGGHRGRGGRQPADPGDGSVDGRPTQPSSTHLVRSGPHRRQRQRGRGRLRADLGAAARPGDDARSGAARHEPRDLRAAQHRREGEGVRGLRRSGHARADRGCGGGGAGGRSGPPRGGERDQLHARRHGQRRRASRSRSRLREAGPARSEI